MTSRVAVTPFGSLDFVRGDAEDLTLVDDLRGQNLADASYLFALADLLLRGTLLGRHRNNIRQAGTSHPDRHICYSARRVPEIPVRLGRLTISIVGPGNLGSALALTLPAAGYPVKFIAVRNSSSGRCGSENAGKADRSRAW